MKIKNGISTVILLAATAFVFFGCTRFIVPRPGTEARQNARIAFPSAGGNKALLWKGKQLNIQYSMAHTGKNLDITGSIVIHDDILMTFPAISALFVKLHFLNDAGKVLGTMDITPLYSAFSDVAGPLAFHSVATVPAGTHFFSFGYYGQLRGQPYEANGDWEIFSSPF